MQDSRLGLTTRTELYLAALLVAPVGFMLITGAGVTKSIFYVAALGCAIAMAMRPHDRPGPFTWSFWCTAMLIGWLTMSHVWSSTFSMLELVKLTATGSALVVFLVLGTRFADASMVHRWLIPAGIVAGLLAVAGYVAEAGPREHFGRLLGYGQLRNPVLAGAAFGSLALVSGLLGIRRRVWLVPAAMFVMLTLATGSRAPLLALCIAAFAGLEGRWRVLPLTLMLGVLALPMVFEIPDTALAGRDFTRMTIWLTAVEQTSGLQWLTGSGLGTPFEVVVDGVVYGHAHSGFVATFVQGGLPGALLLVTLAGLLTHRAMHTDLARRLPFIYGLVFILLDGSRMVGDINIAWLVFWLPAGLLMKPGLPAGIRYNQGSG